MDWEIPPLLEAEPEPTRRLPFHPSHKGDKETCSQKQTLKLRRPDLNRRERFRRKSIHSRYPLSGSIFQRMKILLSPKLWRRRITGPSTPCLFHPADIKSARGVLVCMIDLSCVAYVLFDPATRGIGRNLDRFRSEGDRSKAVGSRCGCRTLDRIQSRKTNRCSRWKFTEDSRWKSSLNINDAGTVNNFDTIDSRRKTRSAV